MVLHLVRYEANGVLYELLVAPRVRLDTSAAMLRAPAAVAAVAAIRIVWWAGRVLVGERAAMLGACLFAVDPFLVYYGQEARPYSLVMLFAAVSWGALARVDASSSRRWRVVWAAATIAATYANALAAPLLLVPQLILVR
jgi:mannosyltransferase